MEQDHFFIGEIARRTDVSRDTIRYYESVGVLPEAPRTASGYRLYGSDDVKRIQFIGQAQTLGLTLEEIAQVLQIVDRGHEPCVHVREQLRGRLEETRDRIRQLQELERRLERSLAPDAHDPVRGGGCHCRIIESTEADPGRPPPSTALDDGTDRGGR